MFDSPFDFLSLVVAVVVLVVARKAFNRADELRTRLDASSQQTRSVERFTQEAYSEHGCPDLIEELHPPFGALLKAA
jgi:hypothetical protein